MLKRNIDKFVIEIIEKIYTEGEDPSSNIKIISK